MAAVAGRTDVVQKAFDALNNVYETSYLDQVKSKCGWNDASGFNPLKLMQKLAVLVAGVVLYPMQEANRWMNGSVFVKEAREFVALTKELASEEGKKADVAAQKALGFKIFDAGQSLLGRVSVLAEGQDDEFKKALLVAAREHVTNSAEDTKEAVERFDFAVAAFSASVKIEDKEEAKTEDKKVEDKKLEEDAASVASTKEKEKLEEDAVSVASTVEQEVATSRPEFLSDAFELISTTPWKLVEGRVTGERLLAPEAKVVRTAPWKAVEDRFVGQTFLPFEGELPTMLL